MFFTWVQGPKHQDQLLLLSHTISKECTGNGATGIRIGAHMGCQQSQVACYWLHFLLIFEDLLIHSLSYKGFKTIYPRPTRWHYGSFLISARLMRKAINIWQNNLKTIPYPPAFFSPFIGYLDQIKTQSPWLLTRV